MNIRRFFLLSIVGTLCPEANAGSVFARLLGKLFSVKKATHEQETSGRLLADGKYRSKLSTTRRVEVLNPLSGVNKWKTLAEKIREDRLVSDDYGTLADVINAHFDLLNSDKASLANGRTILKRTLTVGEWTSFLIALIEECALKQFIDKLRGGATEFQTSAIANFGNSVNAWLEHHAEFIGDDVNFMTSISTEDISALKTFSQSAVSTPQQAFKLFRNMDSEDVLACARKRVLVFWTRRALGMDTDLVELYMSITGNRPAMAMMLMDDHKQQVDDYCVYLGKRTEILEVVIHLFRFVLSRSFRIHSGVVEELIYRAFETKNGFPLSPDFVEFIKINVYAPRVQNSYKAGSIIMRTFLDAQEMMELRDTLHDSWGIDKDWPVFAKSITEFHEFTVKGICKEYLRDGYPVLFQTEMNIAFRNAQSDFAPIRQNIAHLKSMCLALPAAMNNIRGEKLGKLFDEIQRKIEEKEKYYMET